MVTTVLFTMLSDGMPGTICAGRWLQVQEPEEEDAVYLRRQQAAVDEINKRGLTLFHASVQVRFTAAQHACSTVLAATVPCCQWKHSS